MPRWVAVLKRNRLKVLGAVVVLALGSSMVWTLCIPHRDLRLEAIRKKGYPVTLAELDAWYPAVAPAENAALVYTKAFALLAGGSTASPYTNYLNLSWPPRGRALTVDEKRELAELLAAKQDALRLLHSAPATGRSRYPIDFRQGFTMLLPHLGRIKGAVQLLTAEALLRAAEGDAEKATEALLAAGHVADSVADEPILISFLVRVAGWSIICARLERVVGLTEFTDDQLGRLQRLVADAERPPGLLRSLVAERVCGLSVFTDRQTQTMAFSGFTAPPAKNSGSLRATVVFGLYRVTGLLQKDKAYYLDGLGRQVAAAELPYPARFTASEQAAATLTNPPSRFYILSRMLMPALARVHGRDADHAARLRAAMTVLAVERFRRGHGNALPDNLAALTPTYFATVPADPFDGQPLRFTRHEASYAVYSVVGTGKDDGGVDWNTLKLKNPRDIVVVVEH